MKRLIIWLACALMCIAPCAHGFDVADFFEFYAPCFGEGKVVLMPDCLRLELAPGKSGEIELITRPENLSIVWKNENDAVCTLSDASNSRVRVSAHASGESVVYVMHPRSGASALVRVRVSERSVRIKLDRTDIRMERGESTVIHASLLPDGAEGVIDWRTTAQENVAAMSYGGGVCRIKALSAGEFDISATLEGGQSATAHVTVDAAWSNHGYRVCITLLVCGAVGLIACAWILKRRAKGEKR